MCFPTRPPVDEMIRYQASLGTNIVVCEEGDLITDFPVLMSGAVKLSKLLYDGRCQIVGFLFCGDVVGLGVGGLGAEKRYPYTVETLQPTMLGYIPTAMLETQITQSSPWRNYVFHRMAVELSVAQEQMLVLGRMTAQEKMARFLLSLSQRAAERGHEPLHLCLPMGRMDIADYLGLTIETVSRTLTGLRKECAIAVQGGHHIIILDYNKLCDLAQTTAMPGRMLSHGFSLEQAS